jgi:hypothetical protein
MKDLWEKLKRAADSAATWVLVVILIYVPVSIIFLMVDGYERCPEVKYTQSWTITAPDGKVWKAVRDE